MDSFNATAAFVLLRPILTFVVVALLALLFAATHCRKLQALLFAFPYHRFYKTVRSEKMITFYATVLEVIVEVITAVILAGVSIVLTSWLLFEEAADRRQKASINQKVSVRTTDCIVRREQGPDTTISKMQENSYFVTPIE